MRLWRSVAVCAALLASAPAWGSWYEAQSDHFRILSEGGTAEAARAYAVRLEKFDRVLRLLHNAPENPTDRINPVTIFVVRDIAAVQRLCAGGGVRSSCSGVAGFYVKHPEGTSAFTPRYSGDGDVLDLNARTVLLHEYSHHFLYSNLRGAYPGWFIEGFAEFYSTADFAADGTVGIGRVAAHRYRGLMSGNPLPMKTMLASGNGRLSDEQREAVYGRGWALIHYLTFEPKRNGQLTRYLAGIADGKTSLASAEAAFGDFKVLEREVEAYVHRRALTYLRIASDKLAIGDVAVRELSAGAATLMPVRLRSDRGVSGQSAPAVAADARRLAAPFASDVAAQLALAEAEYDASNLAAAEAAADRAMAADPASRPALMYKGRAQVARLLVAKSTDRAAWNAARSWLVKANRLEPNDAQPLFFFYTSFLEQKVPPTPSATAGLERVYELTPHNDIAAWLLARQYLRDKRLAEARRLLVPIAFSPHAPADNLAARLITMIDAKDAAGLEEALKEPPDTVIVPTAG